MNFSQAPSSLKAPSPAIDSQGWAGATTGVCVFGVSQPGSGSVGASVAIAGTASVGDGGSIGDGGLMSQSPGGIECEIGGGKMAVSPGSRGGDWVGVAPSGESVAIMVAAGPTVLKSVEAGTSAASREILAGAHLFSCSSSAVG